MILLHSVTCRRKDADIEIENFSKLELNSTLSLLIRIWIYIWYDRIESYQVSKSKSFGIGLWTGTLDFDFGL